MLMCYLLMTCCDGKEQAVAKLGPKFATRYHMDQRQADRLVSELYDAFYPIRIFLAPLAGLFRHEHTDELV